MANRYNPPPNWPPPPAGWSPPPGWQPDPSWGPPPDGWQLWIDDGRPEPKKGSRLPRWRVMTWVILAFNVLMLVWLISALAATSGNCEGEVGDALDACETGTAIGAGIGIFLLVAFWAFVDVILGVIWLVTRGSQRSCPVCGNSVKKGQFQCRSCGYDFRQIWQRAS